jgi:hypothetical protein
MGTNRWNRNPKWYNNNRFKKKCKLASRKCYFFYKDKKLEDYKRVCDYGIKEYDKIYYEEFASGGGPLPTTHICPYGCGRQIPDNYKGCTELLKDIPNYFG